MAVFVDTGAFYALCSDTDDAHAQATTVHEQLETDGTSLVTTNYVVLETVSLLQYRHGAALAERFGDSIVSGLEVVWIDETCHRDAWKFWKLHQRRGLSLVDCASFMVMRQQHIRRAFAFDQHFSEAGFSLLPGVGNGHGRVAEPAGRYRAHRRPRRT